MNRCRDIRSRLPFLGFALVFALLVLPAYASAATLYVDDLTGADTTDCSNPATPCQTITYAITQEPSASGDTIQVGGGTYSESVTLAKAEILDGEDFQGDADTALPAIVNGAALAACPNPTITVTTGATVQDLTLRSQDGCQTVRVDTGAGSSTVQRNIFDDAAKTAPALEDLVLASGGSPTVRANTFSDPTPTDDQVALLVEGGTAGTIGGLTPLDANTFNGFNKGIVVGSSGGLPATPTIQNNTITATHLATAAGVGIEIGNDSNPTLTGNLIQVPGTAPTIGVRIQEDLTTMVLSTGATLINNQIRSHTTGLEVVDTAGAVTLFNDVIDLSTGAAGGAGLVSTDTLADGGGDVSAGNVDIINTVTAPEVELTDTTLTLDSSIIGTGANAGIDISGGSATANCVITNSRLPAGAVGSGCDTAATNATPIFVGTLGNEYKLTSANPAFIDKGNPGVPPGLPLTDLYGATRIVDGDFDANCVARLDIGAAEYQPPGVCVPVVPDDGGATAVRKAGLFEILSVKLNRKIGVYRLCVTRGKKSACKRFRGKSSAHSVNWSKKLPYKGPGKYTVNWFTAKGNTKLGPTREFTWGACAPGNLSMKGVWKPHRLIIVDRCYKAQFIVNNSFHVRNDGDTHVKVNPIGGTPGHFKNYELIPRDKPKRLPRPANGRRVEVEGVFVCDTFHGPVGHTEIHPTFRESWIDGKGDVFRSWFSGPERGRTPRVGLTPKGRFHCPGVA